MTYPTTADLVRGLDDMSKNPRTRSEHREFLARCRDALQALAEQQSVIDAVRNHCAGVEYKVPGRHETWDQYHEGRSALSDEVEQILDRRPDAAPRAACLPMQLSDALNQAADDVLGVAGREDDRLVDAVNLVVNAGLHYVEHPGDDLDDAIEASYQDTEPDECCGRDIAQTVRGWLAD